MDRGLIGVELEVYIQIPLIMRPIENYMKPIANSLTIEFCMVFSRQHRPHFMCRVIAVWAVIKKMVDKRLDIGTLATRKLRMYQTRHSKKG